MLETHSNISVTPTCDMCPASVMSMMKLMLAMAQECFVIKAKGECVPLSDAHGA